LGLIRLKFRVEGGRIDIMRGRLAGRPTENKPKLLDQVRDVIRRKHYSLLANAFGVRWIA
jgi:hypothetical protein